MRQLYETAWRRCGVALMIGWLPIACAWAQPADEAPGGVNRSAERVFNDPWRERTTRLPAPPRERDLLQFKAGTGSLEYFLDRRSISLAADNVTRFSVVIRSPTATNVLYEGIRCETREYKAYGYASRDKPLKRVASGRWKPILARRGATNFRYQLLEGIICDEFNGLPVEPAEIQSNLAPRSDPTILGKD